MSSARHYFAKPDSTDRLKGEINADVAAARKAQKQMQEVGNHGLAARMGDAVDEALDELNDVSDGTWRPRHT